MLESWSITRVARQVQADYRAAPKRYFWFAVAVEVFAFVLNMSFISGYGSAH